MIDWQKLLESDRQHVWHPYSAVHSDLPVFPIKSAQGVYLTLPDGRKLIDGMSSWWSAIHGYNHPYMNRALTDQLQQMSHVMFGGLTHQPAIELAKKLVSITPSDLDYVFFVDSGSVAVEVALKMAIQYWHAKQQPERKYFLTVRGGYHGDTFAAMSVSDPDNGMHHLFSEALTPQFYAPKPNCKFGEPCSDEHVAEFEHLLQQHQSQLAGVIIEPIVQGAGGMNFYSA
jgi:adenosylmethionine-8-amino-7-oxononanoate aminotransferase